MVHHLSVHVAPANVASLLTFNLAQAFALS